MTNETKQWLLQTGWKHYTLTQLAQKTGETTTIITTLFKANDIKPITHRDIVTGKLLDIYKSPECKSIDDAAILCGCSVRLITEINDEWQLGIPTKMEYKKRLAELEGEQQGKKKQQRLPDEVRGYVNALLRAQSGEKIERAAGIYTQSGSEILDTLRGIKTTGRPNTLLTNK